MIYIAKLYEKYIERYGLNIFSEHPEKIPTPCYLDLQAEVTQFYSEMFDIDVDNDLYAMMLSGSGIRNASQNGGA